MNKPAFDPKAFVLEILKDAHAMAFFKKFDVEPDRIKEFLSSYSEHKANVLEKGDDFTRHIQQMGEEHKEVAWKAYGAILNRKTFILQCRWRAEQVVLKDIAISYDFWYWGRDPYNCPFLDEVTTEEMELMKAFLSRPDFRRWDLAHYSNWQDYDKFVAPPDRDTNKDEDYPLWFAHCDAHGTDPDWRSLPDIWGPKEEAYLEAGREARRTRRAAYTPTVETKKSIEYRDRDLKSAELADLLGDTATAQYLRDRYFVKKGQYYPEVDAALMYFEAFHTEKIPVQANKNWGKGLNIAADQFFARKAAAALEETHEEYIYRKANNLLEKEERNVMRRIADRQREFILEGRKLKGEPGDLNF